MDTADDARDAVSESFARMVQSLARLDATKSSAEAWCFGILRHVVVDQQRTRIAVDGPCRSSHCALPSGRWPELAVDHQSMRTAFARLTPRDRDLLELRVVAGLSADEVAECPGHEARHSPDGPGPCAQPAADTLRGRGRAMTRLDDTDLLTSLAAALAPAPASPSPADRARLRQLLAETETCRSDHPDAGSSPQPRLTRAPSCGRAQSWPLLGDEQRRSSSGRDRYLARALAHHRGGPRAPGPLAGTCDGPRRDDHAQAALLHPGTTDAIAVDLAALQAALSHLNPADLASVSQLPTSSWTGPKPLCGRPERSGAD